MYPLILKLLKRLRNRNIWNCGYITAILKVTFFRFGSYTVNLFYLSKSYYKKYLRISNLPQVHWQLLIIIGPRFCSSQRWQWRQTVEVITTADNAGWRGQIASTMGIHPFLLVCLRHYHRPIVISIELFVPVPQEQLDIRSRISGTLYDILNVLRLLPCYIGKKKKASLL